MDASDRYADFRTSETLAGVDQRDVLRCNDDHSSPELLRQRQLDVPVPGGNDDQVVNVASWYPRSCSSARYHGPRHTMGIDVDQEADRHRLHAVGLERLERLAVSRLGLLKMPSIVGCEGP